MKNSASAAMVKHNASSVPRTAPVRTWWPGSRSLNSHHRTSGAIQPEVKLRWPLACEMNPGANPMNNPPTAAAPRRGTSQRRKKKYHATADAARFPASTVTNVTWGPASQVSGAKRIAYTVTEVLAARFTPRGVFSMVVKNGSPPWVSSWTPYPSVHSKKPWSPTFAARTWSYGWAHSPRVTHTASATAATTTGQCRRNAPRTAGSASGSLGESADAAGAGAATDISRRLARARRRPVHRRTRRARLPAPS